MLFGTNTFFDCVQLLLDNLDMLVFDMLLLDTYHPHANACHLFILLVITCYYLTHVYHLAADVLSPNIGPATSWQDPLS